jgi:hypothetical protein
MPTKPVPFMMLSLALVCVVLFAGVAVLQDRLLYFPAKAAVADMVSDGLRAWPARDDFRGLVAEPAVRAPRRSSFTAMQGMPDSASSTPGHSRRWDCA